MKKFKAFIALDSKTNIENLRVVKNSIPMFMDSKLVIALFITLMLIN